MHSSGPTWFPMREADAASVAILAFSSWRSKPSLRRKTILRGGVPGIRMLPTKLPPEEKLNTLRTYTMTTTQHHVIEVPPDPRRGIQRKNSPFLKQLQHSKCLADTINEVGRTSTNPHALKVMGQLW